MSRRLVDHPVFAQWDYEKNVELDPAKLTCGSSKVVHWICDVKCCSTTHAWKADIYSRTKGSRCPYCFGTSVCDCNRLSLSLDIMKQWDYKKNVGLDPAKLARGSNKVVHWICEVKCCSVEHSFEAAIHQRTSGSKCPYCSTNGKKICDCNRLSSNLELMKQWDYVKNNIDPALVCTGSSTPVHWICSNKCCSVEHSWMASPGMRTYKNPTGCPFCSKNTETPCFCKSVASNTKMMEMWNDQKNPQFLSLGSGQNVEWKCTKENNPKKECMCKHEWSAAPLTIFNALKENRKTQGCPFCQNRQPCCQTLQNLFPIISKQWNYEKNMQSPSDYAAHSDEQAFWTCDEGHVWEAAISSRTTNKTGCPKCSSSTLEQNVRRVLDSNKIKFFEQDRRVIDNSKILTKFGLTKTKTVIYDFCIHLTSKRKCFIEVDGKQHFMHVKFFHPTKEEFLNLIKVDRLKNTYAHTILKFHFLRISYDVEFEIYEKLILNFISKCEKANPSQTLIEIHNSATYNKLAAGHDERNKTEEKE